MIQYLDKGSNLMNECRRLWGSVGTSEHFRSSCTSSRTSARAGEQALLLLGVSEDGDSLHPAAVIWLFGTLVRNLSLSLSSLQRPTVSHNRRGRDGNSLVRFNRAGRLQACHSDGIWDKQGVAGHVYTANPPFPSCHVRQEIYEGERR